MALDALKRVKKTAADIAKFTPPPTPTKAVQRKIKSGLSATAKGLLKPDKRNLVRYGGRGGGKSHGIAEALIYLACCDTVRVLCCREFLNSIRESSHSLLARKIRSMGLQKYFTIQRERIVAPYGGEFIFRGLHLNNDSIKSIDGITHCWVEEAASISDSSWKTLVPSIREPNSQIFISFNPEYADDVMYAEFVAGEPEADSDVQSVSWRDNPHFPEVLERERLKMLRRDPEQYEHIWEGGLKVTSKAQIYSGHWRVEEFVPLPTWEGPLHGSDFGFASDPTAGVQLYIGDGRLYVYRESYEYRLQIDKIAAKWEADFLESPASIIEADAARPDTISYLKRHGLPNIRPGLKGKGSVEEGIEHVKTLSPITIHPRCENTIKEMKKYQYKTDKKSGVVLPIILDADNHIQDSIRYALSRHRKAWLSNRNGNASKKRSRWRG